MVSRRWISVVREGPVSCVAPSKPVRPEMLLYEGAAAPDRVEVRRTYETVFERMLRALSGSATRHVIDLAKVADDGRIARYEDWPAAHYPPPLRPTHLFYRDLPGRRRQRSTPLTVTPTVEVTLRRPAAAVKISDPSGTIPGGVEFPLRSERTMKGTVRAPEDPEVEIFVVSPFQGSESLSLDEYVQSSLTGIEEDLSQDPALQEASQGLRSTFHRLYEPFVGGSGRIEAEVASPRRTVGPGESAEFEVSLRPERPGEMMIAIAARAAVGNGEVLGVSEMLPLHWEEGDPWTLLETTDMSTGWTLVDDEPEPERVRAPAAPPPLKEREAGA